MPSGPQRSLSSPQTPVPREGNGMELGRGGYVLGPRDIRMLTAVPGGLQAVGQPDSLQSSASCIQSRA